MLLLKISRIMVFISEKYKKEKQSLQRKNQKTKNHLTMVIEKRSRFFMELKIPSTT